MASILNVDKIRATGSTTDAIKILSTGHIPCFQVYMSGNQTIAQAAAATVVFNANDFLHGWTLANTGILTCSSGSGGIYSINFRVRINSGSDGNWYARIRKNGNSLVGEYMQNEYYEYANVATLVSIADSDEIEAVVFQNIASISDTIGGNDLGPNCYMYGYRVSG